MKRRGIIAAPEVNLVKLEDGMSYSNELDPTYLRQCVLYWDMIDYPEAIIDHEELDEDLKLLQTEGILQRTRGHFFKKKVDEPQGTMVLSFPAEHPLPFWITAQLYAYLKHHQNDEEWSMGQINTDLMSQLPEISHFFFVETGDAPKVLSVSTKPLSLVSVPTAAFSPSTHLNVSPSLQIELHKALPVPDASVPIETVLQFKLKHHDELLRFRHSMDKMILQITNSVDESKAVQYSKDELELALRDLHILMDETRMKKITPTIASNIGIDPVGIGRAIIGGAIAHTVGLPAISAMLAGIASSIKISSNLSSRKPKEIPNHLKDYLYLYHVDHSLGKR